MRIGIIVAMDSEKQQLLPLIDGLQTTLVNDYEIATGRIGANDVAVMLTGIGKVNAAVGAVSLIDTFRPDVMSTPASPVAPATAPECSMWS